MRETTMSGIPSGRDDDRKAERGYLLVTAGVLVLTLLALISSFSFIFKRDSSYKANYAAGERFAQIAAQAHFFAQQQFYNPTPNQPFTPGNACQLLTAMNLPDNDRLPSAPNVDFALEICATNAGPVNATTVPALRAATAYLHLKVRPRVGGRSPSDTVAFLAGAAAHGMQRVGIYGTVAGNTSCNGVPSAAVMRWGPDASACLTNDLINLGGPGPSSIGFTDVQPGDIIAPAWETALAQNDIKVIYRYPQPERPDSSTMQTDLDFVHNGPLPATPIDCTDPNVSCMTNAGEVRTNDLNSSGFAVIGDGGATDEMLVRQGSPTNLTTATTNNSLRILDHSGALPNAMTVTGGTVDLSGTTTSVGETIRPNPGGTINVSATNPVVTNWIGAKTQAPFFETPYTTNLALNLGGTAGNAKISQVADGTDTPTAVSMTNNAKRFSTLGGIGAPNATQAFRGYNSASMDVYAARLVAKPFLADGVTPNNARVINGTPDTLNWSVGSIDQRYDPDVTKRLTVYSITVGDNAPNHDCIGRGCPNSATANPGGGF